MGIRLREIRKKCGVTQFELGKFIDVHPQRISEVEHGKGDMKFKQAIKAAEFLNVSLDELAGLDNNKAGEIVSSKTNAPDAQKSDIDATSALNKEKRG